MINFMIKCVCFILINSFTSVSFAGEGIPLFNEAQAFKYLEQQCAFGPRDPGSTGHQKCLEFLFQELQNTMQEVRKQPFLFTIPGTQKTVMLSNVISSIGTGMPSLLLCAHWDTRPWADEDPDLRNRTKPILGANDGASGVAVLLEVARVLKRHPPSKKVGIVFFDGEDSGLHGQTETWCQGSRYFAQHLEPAEFPSKAILLDLIGDRDLKLPIEGFSNRYAPQLVSEVWRKAKNLGLLAFEDTITHHVIDDHLELLKVGIPAIDIIDYDYRYWHTLEDTPDKCSPESLGQIGTLLVHLIYE